MNVEYKIININLTSVVTDEEVSNVPCNNCTFCCQKLSPYLSPEEIDSGRYPISLIDPTLDELSNNIGPKVVLFRNKIGGCSMLIDNKCSIYDDRPHACRQFDCRKLHHPKIPDMTLK